MTSIIQRCLGGTIETVYTMPFIAAGGALIGYTYARLGDLPPNQVAKAWAIWSLAHGTLLIFSEHLIDNENAKAFSATVITTASAYFGITELRKRGLMGDKMTVFLISMQALYILGFLVKLSKGDQSQAQAAAG